MFQEQANEEKKGPPVIFKAIQFAKEVFGSSNIDIYHNIQDNSNAKLCCFNVITDILEDTDTILDDP